MLCSSCQKNERKKPLFHRTGLATAYSASVCHIPTPRITCTYHVGIDHVFRTNQLGHSQPFLRQIHGLRCIPSKETHKSKWDQAHEVVQIQQNGQILNKKKGLNTVERLWDPSSPNPGKVLNTKQNIIQKPQKELHAQNVPKVYEKHRKGEVVLLGKTSSDLEPRRCPGLRKPDHHSNPWWNSSRAAAISRRTTIADAPLEYACPS